MSEPPLVLINSCDAFADSWTAAVRCLLKYWPDCPWIVRGIGNHRCWPTISTILVGDDRGWVRNLEAALTEHPCQFVLHWLDDMLLTRMVETKDVLFCAETLAGLPNVGAMRLGQGHEKSEMVRGAFPFYRIRKDSDYRISTSPTLWRTAYLREILANCGETAWNFEQLGTEYSRRLPEEVWTVYGDDETKRPFRCHYTAITRGKWDRNAVEWLKREMGVEVNTDRGFFN